VIYATSAQRGFWRNSEPLDEGQDVRERQELIYLPIGTSVKAEVDIHESSLKKVRVELPTIITVDALPRKSFIGKVARIAPLPDAQSMWMNPDLKVYNTEIYLDGNDGDLRTGMSCKAEIIIEQYDDAIYVPIQAVLRIKGETTVFVLTGGDYEPRKVVIGLDNNRMVRIVSGLDEGEVVLLTPPLKSAVVDSDTRVIASGATDADDNSDTTNGQIQQRLKDINIPQNNGQNDNGSDTGKQQNRKVVRPGYQFKPDRRSSHDTQFHGFFTQTGFFTDKFYRGNPFDGVETFSNSNMVIVGQAINTHKRMSFTGRFLFHRFYRINDNIVTAEFANLLQGFFAGAFAHREHRHDTADTKYHSQHGQKRAQFVEQQIFNAQ